MFANINSKAVSYPHSDLNQKGNSYKTVFVPPAGKVGNAKFGVLNS
jgi:hypothetical protein